MTRRLRQKAGDTLVEVTLAVGIFSMVAVAVVSVVNGSMSKAQAALETTLTRESIDTQADALRFIQAAASIESDSLNEEKPYLALWGKITENAYDSATAAPTADAACEYFSSPEFGGDRAVFAVDVSQLGKMPSDSEQVAWVRSTVHHNNPTNNLFRAASTYPRLVYSDAALASIEGLYVVPVKGDTVNTYDPSDRTLGKRSLYYDFTVHACWNAPGAKTTSHIYTTIRLTNPN